MSPKLSHIGLALVLNLITAVTVMAQPDPPARPVKPTGPAAKKADDLIQAYTARIEKEIEQGRKEVERLRGELHELIDVRYAMAEAIAELRGEMATKGTYSADLVVNAQAAPKTAVAPAAATPFHRDFVYGLGSALPDEPTAQQREQLRRLSPRADLKRMIERLRGGRRNPNRGRPTGVQTARARLGRADLVSGYGRWRDGRNGRSLSPVVRLNGYAGRHDVNARPRVQFKIWWLMVAPAIASLLLAWLNAAVAVACEIESDQGSNPGCGPLTVGLIPENRIAVERRRTADLKRQPGEERAHAGTRSEPTEEFNDRDRKQPDREERIGGDQNLIGLRPPD